MIDHLLFALTMAVSPMPAGAAPAPTAACDKPVYLVVTIDKLDRTKSKAYGEALRSSGIVKRNGGAYRIVGAPVQVLEGVWPATQMLLVEEYPCMAAFRSMWFSDEYQKRIKPLRAGSGTYTIAIFDSYPLRPSGER